jgi:hypothetical protein
VTAPMTGDVALLRHRAKRDRGDLAGARVFDDHAEIDVTVPQITQQAVDDAVASIAEHVQWFNADLPEYDDAMRSGIHQHLAAAAEHWRKLTRPTAGSPDLSSPGGGSR